MTITLPIADTAATSTAALAIDAHDIRREFGTKAALDGVDVGVRSGEIYGFLGPNGAGQDDARARPDDPAQAVVRHGSGRRRGRDRRRIDGAPPDRRRA